MFKLIRYLRPYVGAVVLVFILLFAQAMTDLALPPEYMSRIVNVGIQQYGVEDPVPLVIRQEKLAVLQLLLPDPARSETDAAWQVLDRQSLSEPAYQAALQQYPLLATAVLAELRPEQDLTPDTARSLQQAIALLSMIERGQFSLPGVPAGTDPLALLAQMPDAQRGQLLEQIGEQMQAIPDSVLRQSAIAWIAAEYESIGLDLADIQRAYIFRTGGLMLLIALLGAACTVLVGFFAARVAAAVSRDLRLATFSRVESFSSTEFDTFSTASLITRTTNDIQQIQMVTVMLIRILFYAPILGTGGIIKVLNSKVSMGGSSQSPSQP